MEIPRKVLDTLADGADTLAVLLVGQSLGIDKLMAKLPKVGPLARRAASEVLIAAVRKAGSELKRANAQARENRDFLTATLTQFKLDLEKGVKDQLLIRSLK